MKTNKTEKLQAMMGKHFKNKHNDDVVKFLSFKEAGDQITVATDVDWIITSPFELSIFFAQYQEVVVSEKGEVSKPPSTELITIRSEVVPGNTLNDLRNILLDNIKKVQENRDYVPQAKEISNSIGQIINLAKVEIEMKTKI